MRPSVFRRLGGTLLLTIFFSACTEAPTAPPALERRGGAGIGGLPSSHQYREGMALLAEALAHGRAAAFEARALGLSREEARRAGSAAADAFLERNGIQSRVQDYRAPEVDLDILLTDGQARFVEELSLAVQDLGPSVTVAELERRLAGIEQRAVRELSAAEREPILLAIASVGEFWRANAASASFASAPLADGVSAALLPPKRKSSRFTWGGLADSVAKGVVAGAVTGAIGGAVVFNGPGVLLGFTAGVYVGGVGAGMAYAMDTLL